MTNPTHPATSTNTHDRLELWVLVLFAFVGRAFFVYQHGMPDPDSVAMAAGAALAMSGDVPLGDTVFYGRHVSPGMHVLASRVFPIFLGDPRLVLPFLNWMTVVAASLLVLPLYSLARSHLAHASTLACLGVWMFTPIVWEAGTYYHPLVPATLMFALALVCARRIDRSQSGILHFVLTLALGTAAFITRVEIAFAWPALIVWAASSNNRKRNTGLLMSITVLIAAGYLFFLQLLSAETSGGAKGVGSYLNMLTEVYRGWFSLRGLPRSFTWAVLGFGVATITVCVLLAVRGSGEEPRMNGRRRLIAFALAWSFPPILFWVLVPTPILRHYVLASIGIAWLLGMVFSRWRTKRQIFVAASIIAVTNLAVPELLYRTYNARRSPPKTPNGSFFYFHEMAVERIARNATIAERIVSCSSDREQPSPRSCAMVTWEVFAAVTYAAAVSGHRVEPMPIEMIFPGVRYVRLGVGSGEIRLIHYVYFEDDTLRSTAARIMEESRANGYCLFAPRDLRDRVPELRAFAGALEAY